jgi:heat shock protein HslJ
MLLISVALAAFSSLKVEASITEKPWQWVGLVETNPTSQSVVPDPENYTLGFSPDGSLNIVADCNMAGGSYALDENSLTIELGPSTMAFCGEQSLDYLYLALLSNVESYAVEDGQLC